GSFRGRPCRERRHAMNRADDLHEADAAAERAAEAVLAALPDAPINPAFSSKVLRAARGEMLATQGTWKRAGLFFARVLMPAALLVCAAGWTYHMVHVAERIYLSHAE